MSKRQNNEETNPIDDVDPGTPGSDTSAEQKENEETSPTDDIDPGTPDSDTSAEQKEPDQPEDGKSFQGTPPWENPDKKTSEEQPTAEVPAWKQRRDKEIEDQRKKYVGGGYKRCKRCGSPNTIATSTQGKISNSSGNFIIQFRKCRAPSCRYNFKTMKPD